ncbi:hypothetical protein [Spongiactinospora sp. 9N601]|uniref:hypothetical protein n=1 Tax=Spongiactinospora sp. 9N601 TaxID=3375149 RepID=UPI0037899BB9
MIKYIRYDLGITALCGLWAALGIAAMTMAMRTGWEPMFGVAAAAAFCSGGRWQRRLRCDRCRVALDDQDDGDARETKITGRFVVVFAAAVVIMATAVNWNLAELYGAAVVLALLAGATMRNTLCGDDSARRPAIGR